MQRVRLIVVALTVVAAVTALWLGRTSPGAIAEQERSRRAATTLPPLASSPPQEGGSVEVEVHTIRAAPARIRAELSAVLGPARRVQLASEVAGRVVEVPAEEHLPIEAGGILVRVEQSLLEAAAQRAEAAVHRARANYELAKLELARQQGLARERVASAAEFDRAQSTERSRQAELREAEATLAEARVRLAKTTIRAPFAGVVNELDLEPGAYLRPGDPVAEILDLSEIEVEVGLSDRQVVAIRQGDPVTLIVEVFPQQEFEGRVSRVGRAADARTQKYPIEIHVPNPETRLLPGMLGRVRFDLGEREPAIWIPRRASQKEFEIDYVFVVDGRGPVPSVVRRPITARPVPFRPDLLEVVAGLREGERIAVSRVRELRDGLQVRVRRSGR